jgi:Xaa-Pro aminopeptidase
MENPPTLVNPDARDQLSFALRIGYDTHRRKLARRRRRIRWENDMKKSRARDVLERDKRLSAILDAEFPRFSGPEMARRRALMDEAMRARGVDHLVSHGAWFGRAAVTWLTQWPVTVEALLVYTPGEEGALYIQFYNHVPLARRLTEGVVPTWGGESTIDTAIAELKRRGARPGRVAVQGAVPFNIYGMLSAAFGNIVDMNGDYYRMRLVKSAEEMDWFRIGAALSDLSIDALNREIRVGLTERELCDIVEHAYIGRGGVNVIHFFGVTSMREPTMCVPAQFPSTRKVRKGDVISTEITTNFWDYGGQVLRTFSVGEPLIPPFQELHNAADAAYDAIFAVLRPGVHARELAAAAKVIDDRGFTIYDDLVHGGGGNYGTPVIGTPSRPNHPVPDVTLRPGMLVIVQPNVITRDGSAGIQTGECILITDTGAESIHTAPRGPFQVG